MLNQDLGASKVNELENSAGWVQKQVLRLDVSVADSLRMDVCESSEELVYVQLHFEHGHCCLHLVKVARRSVDGFWHVFED